MKSAKSVAINAARAAGKIILNDFYKKKNIFAKGKKDFTTNVDKACEKKIISIIKKEFSKHSILSEECGEENNNSEFKWIIDPLDGTLNYTSGLPFFCTSIALTKNKEIIVGVVFDPLRNDLYVAEKGKGSFVNGKRLHVSNTNKLDDFFVSIGIGKTRVSEGFKNFSVLIDSVRRMRYLGSTALELCLVARSVFDAHATASTTAWDASAGVLIAEEAGALITNFDGNSWTVDDKTLVVSNGKKHREILKCLH